MDVFTVFGAIIGHLASKGHRPRWTSLAMFLSGVACVFGALPYFFFGPGNRFTRHLQCIGDRKLQIR